MIADENDAGDIYLAVAGMIFTVIANRQRFCEESPLVNFARKIDGTAHRSECTACCSSGWYPDPAGLTVQSDFRRPDIAKAGCSLDYETARSGRWWAAQADGPTLRDLDVVVPFSPSGAATVAVVGPVL